jgi:hypothetical protein
MREEKKGSARRTKIVPEGGSGSDERYINFQKAHGLLDQIIQTHGFNDFRLLFWCIDIGGRQATAVAIYIYLIFLKNNNKNKNNSNNKENNNNNNNNNNKNFKMIKKKHQRADELAVCN